jgi:hypothetical protein
MIGPSMTSRLTVIACSVHFHSFKEKYGALSEDVFLNSF